MVKTLFLSTRMISRRTLILNAVWPDFPSRVAKRGVARCGLCLQPANKNGFVESLSDFDFSGAPSFAGFAKGGWQPIIG